MSFSKGWFAGAELCKSPNYNVRPKGSCISLLVIHSISLPPGSYDNRNIEDFFQNKLERDAHPYFETIADMQVSAHFLIKRDGQIIQFVSCDDRAWHAGQSEYCGRDNCNDYSLGIELEGQDHEPYDTLQYEALSALTEALLREYPSLLSEHIVGHSDIAPGRKTDPGEAFDWPRYRKLISRVG